jgi:ribonuclease HII
MKKPITIGIDEVGRGALAGPVVLSAVRREGRVRWLHPTLGRIRDSKKLSPRQRERWFQYLTAHPAIRWRVTRVGPAVIDRINISAAANRGAARLAEKMVPRGATPCFIWLDGGLVLPAAIPHRAVIKGDERLPIIAAASIIAKVWRDRLMVSLANEFPEYGFEVHKGYGTLLHRKRIRRHGPSVVHRKTFIG